MQGLLQILIVLLAFYATPSAASEEITDLEELLRESCAMLHPTDFRRQADCPDEQRDALRELLKGRPSDVTKAENDIISLECWRRDSHDHNRRLACMQDQYAGLRRLKKAQEETDKR